MILLSLRGSCLRVYGSGLACVGGMKQAAEECALSVPAPSEEAGKKGGGECVV